MIPVMLLVGVGAKMLTPLSFKQGALFAGIPIAIGYKIFSNATANKINNIQKGNEA